MKKILTFALVAMLSASISFAKDFKTLVVTTQPPMHCENCEAKIKGNLRFEKGIKKIETDREKQTVTITYDADKTNPENIKKGFEKINYQASEVAAEKPCCKDASSEKPCCKDTPVARISRRTRPAAKKRLKANPVARTRNNPDNLLESDAEEGGEVAHGVVERNSVGAVAVYVHIGMDSEEELVAVVDRSHAQFSVD